MCCVQLLWQNDKGCFCVQNQQQHCGKYIYTQEQRLLYTLSHSAMEPLVCQFRCSILECNKRFVTRPICNAKHIRYIKRMLHLNCCTRGGLCMHRVITNNSFMALHVTLDLYVWASGRVHKNRTRGRITITCYSETCLSGHLWANKLQPVYRGGLFE